MQAIILHIEDKEDIEEHLGINVEHFKYGRINFSQPKIVQDIINQVILPLKATTIQTSDLAT